MEPTRKTICPSDAARALVAAQRIEVTQSGQPVDLDTARGAIRLRALGLDPDAIVVLVLLVVGGFGFSRRGREA